MPHTRPPCGRGRLWRVSVLLLASLLGIAAICLVVFSQTAKQTQIGVLLGAWAVFVAAPTIFGGRRAQQQSLQLSEVQLQSAQLHEAQLQLSKLQQAQLAAAQSAHQSQELELRRFGELHLARESASRREADFRLEMALRSDIERVLTEQVSALRDEIGSLRAEVVDKLGGQLRLERIETTRVIASDLEALQNEIKRLSLKRADSGVASGTAEFSDVRSFAPSAYGNEISANLGQSWASSTSSDTGPADFDPAEFSGTEFTSTEFTSTQFSSTEFTSSSYFGSDLSAAANAEDEIFDAEIIEHETQQQPPVGPFRDSSVAYSQQTRFEATPLLKWNEVVAQPECHDVGAHPALPLDEGTQPQPQPQPQPFETMAPLPEKLAQLPKMPAMPPPSAVPPPVTATRAAEPATRPASAPAAQPVSGPATDGPDPTTPEVKLARDPFAGLPRLTPLTDEVASLLEFGDDLDTAADGDPANPPRTVTTALPAGPLDGATPKLDRKSGKRRAPEPDDANALDPRYVGRRRSGEDPYREPSGRRRAPDDVVEDLVARIHRG